MEKITKISTGSGSLPSSFLPFRQKPHSPSLIQTIDHSAFQNTHILPDHQNMIETIHGPGQRVKGNAEKSENMNKRIMEKLREVLRKLNEKGLSENSFQEEPKTLEEVSLNSSRKLLSPTVSPRTFSVTPINNGRFQVRPLFGPSTPNSLRIIQPIRIISTPAPSFGQQTFPLSSSSSFSNPAPKPIAFPNQGSQNQIRPSRFSGQKTHSTIKLKDSGYSSNTRPIASDPLSGFPGGLPEDTPKGVRLSLESMLSGWRDTGEMVMNPIPGVAGVDYPVYNEPPYTVFQCGEQEYPGIYTDTDAGCQVFIFLTILFQPITSSGVPHVSSWGRGCQLSLS